jgi:hypothetical protein
LNQGIEIFTQDKKSYFFNLLSEERLRDFLEKLHYDVIKPYNRIKGVRKIEVVENPKQEFKRKHYLDVSEQD